MINRLASRLGFRVSYKVTNLLAVQKKIFFSKVVRVIIVMLRKIVHRTDYLLVLFVLIICYQHLYQTGKKLMWFWLKTNSMIVFGYDC